MAPRTHQNFMLIGPPVLTPQLFKCSIDTLEEEVHNRTINTNHHEFLTGPHSGTNTFCPPSALSIQIKARRRQGRAKSALSTKYQNQIPSASQVNYDDAVSRKLWVQPRRPQTQRLAMVALRDGLPSTQAARHDTENIQNNFQTVATPKKLQKLQADTLGWLQETKLDDKSFRTELNINWALQNQPQTRDRQISQNRVALTDHIQFLTNLPKKNERSLKPKSTTVYKRPIKIKNQMTDYDFNRIKNSIQQDYCHVSYHPQDIKILKTYDIKTILNQKIPLHITAQQLQNKKLQVVSLDAKRVQVGYQKLDSQDIMLKESSSTYLHNMIVLDMLSQHQQTSSRLCIRQDLNNTLNQQQSSQEMQIRQIKKQTSFSDQGQSISCATNNTKEI